MLDQISLSQGCLSNLKKNRNANNTTCNKKNQIYVEIIKKIKIYRKKMQVIQKNSVSKKTKVKYLFDPYTLSFMYV